MKNSINFNKERNELWKICGNDSQALRKWSARTITEMVVEAVLKHSRLNEPTDETVTIALKDADRLANIGPSWYLRDAQNFPRLPVCDPRYFAAADPKATYRQPKTLFHEFRCVLEWEGWLHLPKAKEIAKPWFDEIRRFMAGLENQLKETGLTPYPFEDDFD